MQSHEKTAILNGLKAEEATKLKEQNTYREILKRIKNTPSIECSSMDFEALDWEAIKKHMKGQSWPLTSQDWKELDGREYFETPKYLILSRIVDNEIRFHAYYVSEMTDQTQRIKAMTHFCKLFAAINDEVALIFIAWISCEKHRTAQQESLLESSPKFLEEVQANFAL